MNTLVHSYTPTKHSMQYGGVVDTDILKQSFRVMIGKTEVAGEITVRGDLATVILNHPKVLPPSILIDIYKLSVFSTEGLIFNKSTELPIGHLYTFRKVSNSMKH